LKKQYLVLQLTETSEEGQGPRRAVDPMMMMMMMMMVVVVVVMMMMKMMNN
jgi:heme/copper-type cytochrome/quinol oxidase subunit 2